jgi:antitoxin CcdA
MRMVAQSSSARSTGRPGTRPTNLSLSASLVSEARELGVNISLAATAGLEEAVAKRRAERWAQENAPALASYNEFVEKSGLPLEKWRLF